ncbi:MAG TPA: FHA domain-containing protein [Anaerolineales bacterium]|nr:FHA domain-containing protein [Anaerolineales bacterium]
MEHEEEYPILIAQDGPLKGQRWQLSRTLMIGRDPSCDIQVQDRQVSRFHARITPNNEGVTIEDLGSKNGTNHNGVELTAPIMLQDGDLLGVALAQQFIFLISDATMPLVEGGIRSGRLLMDQKSRQVWVNQQQVTPPLSAQQFKLLWMLYERQGQVVSRSNLVSEEQMAGVSDQALDALIRRLRDRLAVLDPSHQYISTVRGHGIRLDNPPIGE